MKKRYLIAGAVFTLGLSFLLTGCGMHNSSLTRNAGIRAIKRRYGIKLTYAGDADKSGSGNVFGSYSDALDIYAECKELPGKLIHIYSPDGFYFGSDYIPVKYEDDTKELVRSIAAEIYDDSNIRVNGMTYIVNSLGRDTTMEEYLASGELEYVNICTTDNDDPEGDFAKLIDALIENGVNCKPQVYHFKEYVYGSDDYNIQTTDMEYRLGKCLLSGIYPTLDDKFDKGYRFVYQF